MREVDRALFWAALAGWGAGFMLVRGEWLHALGGCVWAYVLMRANRAWELRVSRKKVPRAS